jgi:hypothetical protein
MMPDACASPPASSDDFQSERDRCELNLIRCLNSLYSGLLDHRGLFESSEVTDGRSQPSIRLVSLILMRSGLSLR